MPNFKDGPAYQTDTEPTHDSQPSGATIVYLAAFLLFGLGLVIVLAVTR